MRRAVVVRAQESVMIASRTARVASVFIALALGACGGSSEPQVQAIASIDRGAGHRAEDVPARSYGTRLERVGSSGRTRHVVDFGVGLRPSPAASGIRP
jgi:hypothetical protein